MLELRAWMAARGGDRSGRAQRPSRRSLRLSAADATAIERLADLAAQDGQRERLAELRRRKADIENGAERLSAVDQQARAPAPCGRVGPRGRQDRPAVRRRGLVADRGPARPHARARSRGRSGTAGQGRDAGGRWRNARRLARAASFASEGKGEAPDKLSVPTFVDDAQRRGLVFAFDNGLSPKHQLPETSSGGMAVLDIDGDGWLDIYAIQGGPFPPPPGPLPFSDRLFRNRGDGPSTTSPPRPVWPHSPGAMGTVPPSAISTTTDVQTSSSPVGGPTPFTITSETAGSRT